MAGPLDQMVGGAFTWQRAACPGRASTRAGVISRADGGGERAARDESAAFRWIDRGDGDVRVLPFDPLRLQPGRRVGCGAEQELRVGWRGSASTCSAGPLLDDLAGVHDEDVVGDVAGGGEVVGDVEEGEVVLLLQAEHQVQDPDPDRDVEHAGRLVREHDLRLDRQRPRDRDALALSARELVRDTWRRSRRAAPGRPCAGARARALPPGPAGRSCGCAAAVRGGGGSSSPGSATRTGPGRSSGPAIGSGGRRAAVSRPPRLLPSNRTMPPVGSWRRESRRMTVLLPLPLSPTRAVTLPARRSKETSSTACSWALVDRPPSGKNLVSSRTSRQRAASLTAALLEQMAGDESARARTSRKARPSRSPGARTRAGLWASVVRAPRVETAAARRVAQVGRRAGDPLQPVPWPARRGGNDLSRPCVYGC